MSAVNLLRDAGRWGGKAETNKQQQQQQQHRYHSFPSPSIKIKNATAQAAVHHARDKQNISETEFTSSSAFFSSITPRMTRYSLSYLLCLAREAADWHPRHHRAACQRQSAGDKRQRPNQARWCGADSGHRHSAAHHSRRPLCRQHNKQANKGG